MATVKVRKRIVRHEFATYTSSINNAIQLKVETINKVVSGKKLYIAKMPKDFVPTLMVKDWKQEAAKANPWNYYERVGQQPIWIDNDNINEKQLDEYVRDNRIALLYPNGHVLFDINKVPVPHLFSFHWTNNGFTNEEFYLQHLLTYLKNHPCVHNKKSLLIQDIPHYNCSDDRTKCISDIDILPPEDIYKEMYNSAKHLQFWSVRLHEAVACRSWCKDWLGISKFRKEKKE